MGRRWTQQSSRVTGGTLRKCLIGSAVILLAGCSGEQYAIVRHFCLEPLEVHVVWTIDDTPYDEPSVLVEPEVPTEVWYGCCNPSPNGEVTLSAGGWIHSDAAENYGDGSDVIDIPLSACP